MDLGQIFNFAIPFLERLPTVRAILAFIFMFFLPGFAWTLVFFKQINIIERIALSFGLSIAIVALSIIVLNVLLGIRISATNALLIIMVVTGIPLAIYYFKRIPGRRSESENLKMKSWRRAGLLFRVEYLSCMT